MVFYGVLIAKIGIFHEPAECCCIYFAKMWVESFHYRRAMICVGGFCYVFAMQVTALMWMTSRTVAFGITGV